MNIAEILKDCPKGTKLYCPIYGTVIFVGVDETRVHSIITRIPNEELNIGFTKDGRLNDHYDGECVLFPSKENRDWSTFKVSQKECELMPFDKVLVRDCDTNSWTCDLFSHIDECNEYKYSCMASTSWKQCIPFAGNEHLLGTTNKPE